MDKIINTDFYRCITFQPKEVIDRLINTGTSIRTIYEGAKRDDKTEFYRDYLALEGDILPMYAWASFWYCGRSVKPIDVFTLASSWSYHMGFMQMSNKYIIELDIPASECVLGKHGSIGLCGIDYEDDSVEAVFREIKMEWVAGIYMPANPKAGKYEQVEFVPIYRNGSCALINNHVSFNGTGYPIIDGIETDIIQAANYYRQFGWEEPMKGLSLIELSRVMSIDAYTGFIDKWLGLTVDSEVYRTQWEDIRNKVYL